MNVLSQRNQEKVEEDQGNALIAGKKDILQGIVHNLESLEKEEVISLIIKIKEVIGEEVMVQTGEQQTEETDGAAITITMGKKM